MITAGIDVGAKYTKAVILKDGQITGKARVLTGFDQLAAANQAYDEALAQAGLARGDVQKVFATGIGKHAVDFANDVITEIGAAARGGVYFYPAARTVVDVGAEEGRAVKADPQGKAVDFAVNEKCAAGAGTFVETMARALEVPTEDMGPLSLQSTKEVPMNAQCTVFAESEVVSLVHAKTPKADIARAVHDAIASRVSSMVRRVGIEREVEIVGGLAYNPGFIESMKRDLGVDILVPQEPEYAGAVGAALAAAG